jgi:hypothetical protein
MNRISGVSDVLKRSNKGKMHVVSGVECGPMGRKGAVFECPYISF